MFDLYSYRVIKRSGEIKAAVSPCTLDSGSLNLITDACIYSEYMNNILYTYIYIYTYFYI